MAHYSDDDLERMADYGGPQGSEARALLADLRSARAQLREANQRLALPEVVKALEETRRRDRVAQARQVLAEEGEA